MADLRDSPHNMITCPECNHQLIQHMTACPECGFPFEVQSDEPIQHYRGQQPLATLLDKTQGRPSANSRILIAIGLSLVCVLIFIGLRQWMSASNQTPIHPSSVQENMYTLQMMVETYAVDWGGVYPENLAVLYFQATQAKNTYWKQIINPINQKEGIGFEGSMLDVEFFKMGQLPGLVVYIPGGSPIVHYWIYGTDETGNILQKNGQDMVLSNSSDRPQSFEQVKELVLASSPIPPKGSPTPASQQIITIPSQEMTATASTSLHMTTKRAEVDFTPDKVLDNDHTTNWQEDAPGNGVGEWIQLSFNPPRQIHSLDIRNGYADTNDAEYGNLFEKNNRVQDATVTYSNGTSIGFPLSDSLEFQTIQAPSNQVVEWARITIKSVYKGRKYDDTCISDIIVHGYQ